MSSDCVAKSNFKLEPGKLQKCSFHNQGGANHVIAPGLGNQMAVTEGPCALMSIKQGVLAKTVKGRNVRGCDSACPHRPLACSKCWLRQLGQKVELESWPKKSINNSVEREVQLSAPSSAVQPPVGDTFLSQWKRLRHGLIEICHRYLQARQYPAAP